ncbi:c-type cytochrome [Bradyrhizobium sp. CCBAU 25338]|uniref:c-type cytochrome n=1 Tax=Bradyrhizobium sp. CCBAU 25338 TaxID=1641877 RepID=UPI00230430AE|nr:cytochrome c [Bradyrhizobium sp. CCBAU 25338]MDA9533695.1 alkylated DNA repair protein [Bradyrhizobium sp. CCBAU 25338]
MLQRTIVVALLVAIAAAGLYWWLSAPVVAAASAIPARAPDLANGEVMFNAGGCASCHAVPNQPDRLRLGGGVAIKSPFGTFHAPNISPDPNDGIGKWTDADFVNAVMRGVSPSGQHYFPAFPYTSYQHARREDVLDLFAYLKTLPAVAGKVRDHEVSFPFDIRRNIGIWKFLFMDGKPFVADGSKSPQWNRGAYLVNSFGHCAECHSPRNALGGIISGERFAGGPNPEGEGWVPNITQKRLGEWSAKDLAYFLKTGELPDGDSVGGAMTRVIKNTSQLPDQDLSAMAEYLKSLPPVDGPTPPKRKQGS